MIVAKEHRTIAIDDIGKVAAALGVTYNYLWCVLSGKLYSAPLVLKIKRECPSLFRCRICKIDWRKIVSENSSKYRWDEHKEKYVLKK